MHSLSRTPLADLCLHFIVTWAMPAGLGPGKARDKSITIHLDKGSSNFSVTGQRVNILGFAGHTVCVITPPCHSSLHRLSRNNPMLLHSNSTVLMDSGTWHNSHIWWNIILWTFSNIQNNLRSQLYKNRWQTWLAGDHSLLTSDSNWEQSTYWIGSKIHDKVGVLIVDSEGEMTIG